MHGSGEPDIVQRKTAVGDGTGRSAFIIRHLLSEQVNITLQRRRIETIFG
ncbi:hypothetical protein MMALV_13510 [Candidatus Methanomethylophilus alvi Mx1201]|uniref:Uncharacterized protein n=1 Tax=Methanomethylophilus alvi (strain Mx1201) TaxID=1236689 RepID=M9SF85_METAX|nr:hypothetical protein MMALV_13510 [Candidatus Methanomethylophilus alvi Mx1201]